MFPKAFIHLTVCKSISSIDKYLLSIIYAPGIVLVRWGRIFCSQEVSLETDEFRKDKVLEEVSKQVINKYR